MPSICALITGASSGIGQAFAEALAAAGYDLILVARSRSRLETLAGELAGGGNRRVEVLPADLTQAGAADQLASAVADRGLAVDLLINNAGFGTVGAFESLDPAREADEIALNAGAVVGLCHAFVPGMLARGAGSVINVASLAAFQPTPYMSVYGATKAFVLSFSLGLWAEVHHRGVKVLALCPGPVDTPFFEATGNLGLRSTVPRGAMMSAPAVVAAALKALAAGRPVCVPGLPSRALASATRLLPRAVQARLAARLMRR